MRPKAGEVLADRELETAQRGEADPDADRKPALVTADDEADDEEDDPDEDADLDERKRSPRRGRRVSSAAARLRSAAWLDKAGLAERVLPHAACVGASCASSPFRLKASHRGRKPLG